MAFCHFHLLIVSPSSLPLSCLPLREQSGEGKCSLQRCGHWCSLGSKELGQRWQVVEVAGVDRRLVILSK